MIQRYELTCYFRGIHEPIYTTISQVDWKSTCRLYRHFGANSDGAAWFLICTSLISQQEQAEVCRDLISHSFGAG
ncbi:hypothetical protein VN97_g12344 [Penicillium thymicola]|uniref:Uncharacterized protein n=1 Tax=Penicillium thymicola TaxID=293382 RepID=A0AAI9T6J0_PENTH|nr:hypothetical protein VN97_g12344 [Penicillium thymicola]